MKTSDLIPKIVDYVYHLYVNDGATLSGALFYCVRDFCEGLKLLNIKRSIIKRIKEAARLQQDDK